MAGRRNLDRLDLDERLIEGPETNAAVDWPVAIHHRVDQLVDLAMASGERTTRKELVAALMLAAPESGEGLGKLLRKYRTSVVREVLLNVKQGDNVIELRRPGPGPRVRKPIR